MRDMEWSPTSVLEWRNGLWYRWTRNGATWSLGLPLDPQPQPPRL